MNKTIKKLKKRIDKAFSDLKLINEREELLTGSQTEFPKLEEAQRSLKPFEDLWNLAKISREK
jgi:hypothetical protein